MSNVIFRRGFDERDDRCLSLDAIRTCEIKLQEINYLIEKLPTIKTRDEMMNLLINIRDVLNRVIDRNRNYIEKGKYDP